MKLYDGGRAPNPRRVRIFLAEKGISVPLEPVDLGGLQHKSPGYTAVNPLQRLPALELDDGTVLTESIAICRYFEELMPEPPLFGRSSAERVAVEMWNRRMEHELFLPVIDVFLHTHDFWVGRRQQVPTYGDLRRQQVIERMQWLDKELEGREFIGVDRYNIADITAQVAILTARGALRLRIPEDHKNLSRWWEAVSRRPSARA